MPSEPVMIGIAVVVLIGVAFGWGALFRPFRSRNNGNNNDSDS